MPHQKPTIRLNHDALEYCSPQGEIIWTIAVKDVVLFAEYTNDEGPLLDDYFLVFVTIEQRAPHFVTASFYSNGCNEIIQQLAKYWNVDLDLQLYGSTDWRSRIVWPPSLAGQECFDLTEVPPASLLARLRKFVLGPAYEFSPSKNVLDFLQRAAED